MTDKRKRKNWRNSSSSFWPFSPSPRRRLFSSTPPPAEAEAEAEIGRIEADDIEKGSYEAGDIEKAGSMGIDDTESD